MGDAEYLFAVFCAGYLVCPVTALLVDAIRRSSRGHVLTGRLATVSALRAAPTRLQSPSSFVLDKHSFRPNNPSA